MSCTSAVRTTSIFDSEYLCFDDVNFERPKLRGCSIPMDRVTLSAAFSYGGPHAATRNDAP